MTSYAAFRKGSGFDSDEIAIAGKSNVGKSSFINYLANHGGLAKTSSTPGKTKLINLQKSISLFILREKYMVL